MEAQSKKVFEKALEIYHTETNSIISSNSTKDLVTLKKTHRQLEDQLRKYLFKELRSYAKLSELTEKLLVFFLKVL